MPPDARACWTTALAYTVGSPVTTAGSALRLVSTVSWWSSASISAVATRYWHSKKGCGEFTQNWCERLMNLKKRHMNAPPVGERGCSVGILKCPDGALDGPQMPALLFAQDGQCTESITEIIVCKCQARLAEYLASQHERQGRT